MGLAFRLYGYFQWPPTDAPKKAPKAGIVEIYFEPPPDDTVKAFLRWRPIDPSNLSVVDGAMSQPAQGDNIFLPSGAHLIGQLASGVETSTWIFDPDGNFGARLTFAGAFLFEQYNPAAPEPAPGPELVWPLAIQCQYDEGGDLFFSKLIIGQGTTDYFRFDLQLPTPFPQTTLPDATAMNPSVLPFSALYDPSPSSLAVATKIAVLSMGASGRSKTYQQKTTPTQPLGQFGFTANGTDPDFAPFAPKPGVPAHIEDYWPKASARDDLVDYVFKRIGFKADTPSELRSLQLSTQDERRLSVRFVRPTHDAPRTGSLIYRLAIAVDGKGNIGDDFQWNTPADDPAFRCLLALKDELGGALRIVAKELFVDLILSWSIEPDRIWALDRDVAWKRRIVAHIHWEETIFNGLLAVPGDGEKDDGIRLYRRGGLVDAAASATDAHSGLQNVEGAEPLSALPVLSLKQDATVRFLLASPAIAVSFDANGMLAPPPKAPAWRPSLRLTLAADEHQVFKREVSRLQVYAQFPGIFQPQETAGVSLQISADAGWTTVDIRFDENVARYFASFALNWPSSSAAPANWRLSSLEFHADNVTKATGRLRCGGPGIKFAGRPGAAPIDGADPTAVSFELSFGVDTIVPRGVDVTRGDRSGRAVPLLIPLDSTAPLAKQSEPIFTLAIHEQIALTDDHLLTATIYDTRNDPGAQDYVILSEEPFSLLRLSEAGLAARGDIANAAVAAYSSDDRVWTLKQVTDRYHYILPPQVVGESADKPQRLEIFDLQDTDVGDHPRHPFDDGPSAPITEDDKRAQLAWRDLHRRPIEFRLTPPTEIWVKPSDVQRGYGMPAWDSYQLFRQRGELGLGVSLVALRGEFLYGLPVGIDVSRERGISRQARVAEIEALTGRVVGEALNEPAEHSFSLRWNALAAAILRRPERLELWANNPDSTVAFAPALFKDGVSFALRDTALHRAPVIGPDGEFENSGVDPDVHKAPQGARLRYHPQGLSGGALWPVESDNLFRILKDQPDAEGGSIESIALSPTGGDATQTAEFLNGIVRVVSETRNGFIERQKIEIIGRIGALWHRAKHVVVYQRTTSPSAQFAPKFEEDPNHFRSRRPILRKVSEYIEFIEWERHYPDFPDARQRHAGFLESVRFNSRKINVDSAWSRDVGRSGWEIPLWNRASARQRPQVYPMPDTAFVATAEGDGDSPIVALECRDPEKLFFFTDFLAASANTNLWPPRIVIDYLNLPSAAELAHIADGKSNDPTAGSGRRRAVRRVLPGASRFTWRLAPAARKSAINAGRAVKPIYVGLDSVTFMRNTQAGGLQDNLGTILSASGVVDPAALAFQPIHDLAYWKDDGTGGPEGATAFATGIATLRNATPDKVAAAQAAIQNGYTLIAKNIAPKLDGATKVANQFKGVLGDATDFIGVADQKCQKLKADALGTVRGKSTLVIENIKIWQSQIDTLLDEPGVWKTTKHQLIVELSADIVKLVRPIFTEAAVDVGRGEQDVETVRATVADVDVEIEAVFERARGRMSEFSASYDRSKPWSADRRAAFQAGIYAAIDNVAEDIQCAIDEARQRFAVELANASQAIGGHLSKTLADIAGEKVKALAQLSTLRGMLLAPAYAMLESFLASGGVLDTADQKIKKAQADISAKPMDAGLKARALAALARADAALGPARTAAQSMQSLSDSIATDATEAGQILAASVDALFNGLKGLIDALKASLSDFDAVVNDLNTAAFENLATEVGTIENVIVDAVADVLSWITHPIEIVGQTVDIAQARSFAMLDEACKEVRSNIARLAGDIDTYASDVANALEGLRNAFAPDALLEKILVAQVIIPALDAVLTPLPEALPSQLDAQFAATRSTVIVELSALSDKITDLVAALKVEAIDAIDGIADFCSIVADDAQGVVAYFNNLAQDAAGYINGEINRLQGVFNSYFAQYGQDNDLKRLIAGIQSVDYAVRGIQNDLARSAETARMYGDRVMDAFSKIDPINNPLAAPSKLLRLYSAVTSAPEIAALKSDIDRIRSSFDEVADVIQTTRATALFNHLGDELKALGLSLPFDSIGERIIPADLSTFDISSVFRRFGGVNLDKLLGGYKLPAGVADAVRVTHDFDKTQARAWVQVDIDAPIPGRCSLFSVEVFQADFVDMRLTGTVRLEASKDSDTVSQTGYGRIVTDLDMVAGGQSLVTFQGIALNFTKESGLKVEFDPTRIKLNPGFQFVQDFLSTLFPDDIGGLRIIKRDGMPIGLAHEFSLPPISLIFGTSGVSNISISNSFQLLAYPDFILADRFSLSRPELPFIFSVFIIGGSGYIQLDAEYQPFKNELSVAVEAAAGGSATLGLAFGPFSGEVFISLSVTITYRKIIGKSGGGLSIGMVLVIAGSVTVCGIVTVGIFLLLRMSYRDNGQVDADGTLSVTISISRFFKISARAEVQYKLRGGRSETKVSAGAQASITNARAAADNLKMARA